MKSKLKNLCKDKHKYIKLDNRQQRNNVQKQIVKLVRQQRHSVISKMSAQEIFDEIKRHLRSQEKMPLPTIAEAETLNKHFTRFNCDLDKDIQPTSANSNNSDNEIKFSADEVAAIFKRTSRKTSSGPSKLPAQLFKNCADILGKVYCDVYNKSFSQTQYPNVWKSALVTAVPKKNDISYNDVAKFRPISVTPIQARVLDKLALMLLESTMKHTEDPFQFAYKSHLSTSDALIVTIDQIANFLDNNPGMFVKCCFLDYSSAFNTVLQNSVLNKISPNDDKIAAWLSSYFTDWNQCVRVKKGKTSSCETILRF